MSDAKPLSSDELALRRTVLAVDRTLMAWIRTALALISFGFTSYKFLQYVREEARPPVQVEGPRNLGMALISMGVLFLLLASLQSWREFKRLEPHQKIKPWRLSLALALLLALLGVLALANVAFRIGPF